MTPVVVSPATRRTPVLAWDEYAEWGAKWGQITRQTKAEARLVLTSLVEMGESNRGRPVLRRSYLSTTLGCIRACAVLLFTAVRQRPPGLLSALLSTGEQSRREVSAPREA